METGKYYEHNQKKLAFLTDNNWRAALDKCKKHIDLKLKQKTLSGAHSSSNLGTDPIDYYLEVSFQKLLLGEWEWKDEYDIATQMIRIINSYISKEVEKASSVKAQSFQIQYRDFNEEFYEVAAPPESTLENNITEARIQIIESAISGDEEIEYIFEAIKEGKKRSEIAELLEINPRQFDKKREKLIRLVLNYQSSPK